MANKQKKNRKRKAWNKGVQIGQRGPFKPSDVARIKTMLAKRGDDGLRDLALFSIAIDTMLSAPDILGLTVKDVRKRNRVMRDTLELTLDYSGRSIRCTLSETTMSVLEKWISHSSKKPSDYLFPGRADGGSAPLAARQLSRLVKSWAAGMGLDPAAYGINSLRRTRSMYILRKTGNLEAVRALLGHSDIGSTAHFLRDVKQPSPLAVSRAHEL